MAFLLVFFEHSFHFKKQRRIDFSEPLRNVLMHGAFADPEFFCGGADRCALFDYVFCGKNGSFFRHSLHKKIPPKNDEYKSYSFGKNFMQKEPKGEIIICTAMRLRTFGTFIGRTLDLEHRYNETVSIAPRNYPFRFGNQPFSSGHFAMMGMAFVLSGYPLFYDAFNEHGLFAAGLNFPESGVFMPKSRDKTNISSFELIPFVLGNCANICEARELFEHANITGENFREDVPATPLHWFIGDKNGAMVIEQTRGGLKIFDDSADVLTNEPPFEKQLEHWNDFLSTKTEDDLPGDFSSCSRFIKAAYLRKNSVCSDKTEESVTQFFHLLSAISQPEGANRKENGALVKTIYTSCADLEKGIYYYKTYGNGRISAVSLKNENLESDLLISYPLNEKQDILFRN